MQSQSNQIFETKRLQLIPLTLELMKATLAGKARLEEQLGVRVPPTWPGADLAEALPVFIAQVEQTEADFAWNWLIIHKEARVIVGDAGFLGGPRGGIAEIGYSIVPEYRNQGYATETALYLIHWALRQRGIWRVTARCLDDNIGSIKVLEKAGMRRLESEGSMLQWEARKPQ